MDLIDVERRSVRIAFPDLVGIQIVATAGDNVGGWIIKDVISDPSDPDESATVLQPAGIERTVKLWKRLSIPKDGPAIVLTPDQWDKHRLEPDAKRARAEGKLLVRGGMPTSATKP